METTFHDCPVCMEPMHDRISTTAPCGHMLCLPCLVQLQAPQKCPMCRSNLNDLIPAFLPFTRYDFPSVRNAMTQALLTIERIDTLVDNNVDDMDIVHRHIFDADVIRRRLRQRLQRHGDSGGSASSPTQVAALELPIDATVLAANEHG